MTRRGTSTRKRHRKPRPRPAPLTLLEPVPDGYRAPGRWEVLISGWIPTPLNQLLGAHWAAAGRMKKLDSDTVKLFARQARIPAATGKRRISLRIVLPKGQRRYDVDALLKSTLDACVNAKLLIDDNPKWCLLGSVDYVRGQELATTLVVEDVSPDA